MANWCWNNVSFTGSEENVKKVFDLFNELAEKEKTENCGQKPEFVKKDNYFFSIDTNEGCNISFESKWSPNVEEVTEIAKHFNLNFEYCYEESGNCIFGKAVYTEGNEQAEELNLSDEDYDLFTYNDETGVYIYNGQEYDGDYEILESIWEKKFDTSY